MNHVEALKVARDALEVIAVAGEGDGYAARKALAATASIGPVAASILSTKYCVLMIQWHKASKIGGKPEQDAWGELIRGIDAHCAAQVAQAIDAALERAASAIDLLDDTTMKNNYMLDSDECSGIVRAMKGKP